MFGATNQAGEDNRNVARMAMLIAGLPYEVPAVTVNRLCGSGLEAVSDAVRRIATGDAECVIAGGVESMTRAPFVFGKSDEAFARSAPKVYDTSLGWRFENPKMAERFPLQSMGETAENVAEKWKISREDQDAFALASHEKALRAQAAGDFDAEIALVSIPQKKGPSDRGREGREPARGRVARRAREAPARVPQGRHGDRGQQLAAERRRERHHGGERGRAEGREPRAARARRRPARRQASSRTSWARARSPPARRRSRAPGGASSDLDLVELNEAFAAQSLACIRGLELDAARVNVRGGAIALGHPIGSSGCRILVTLLHAMKARDAKRGMAALCIGVGQGIAMCVER